MHYVKHENTEKPRILICAPSNNAIDEIAIRLIEARDERKIKFRRKEFHHLQFIYKLIFL